MPLTAKQLEVINRLRKADPLTFGTANELQALRPKRRAISTGYLGIDVITGIGGIPTGGFTQVYGPKSAGKSTLAMGVIAQAQREDLTTALLDMEATYEPDYGAALGVDNDKLYVVHPDTAEQAVEIAQALTEAGLDLIVWDSVGAFTPEKILEADAGASLPGLRARLMKQALQKLCMTTYKKNVAHLLVNHLVGTMKQDQNGNPILTPAGGEAVQYYSSLNILVKAGEKKKEGGEVVANVARVRIEKNKKARAWREVELIYQFEQGFDRVADLISTATDLGLVTRAGSYYMVGDAEKPILKVQGEEAFVKAISQGHDEQVRLMLRLARRQIAAERRAEIDAAIARQKAVIKLFDEKFDESAA